MRASGRIGNAVTDPRILSRVGPAKPAPHHFISHQRLFLSVGRVGSTTTPSNAPSSLNGVGTIEWKPCAQLSPPGQRAQPMSAAAFGVFSDRARHRHWTSSVTDQRRTISALASGSRPCNGVTQNPSLRHFESEPGSIPIGTLWRPEWHAACHCSYSFCQLILVGISAGIGTYRRQKRDLQFYGI